MSAPHTAPLSLVTRDKCCTALVVVLRIYNDSVRTKQIKNHTELNLNTNR
jgi:hypothetical protein